MSSLIQAVLLVSFGFIPSLVWLSYYLKKDCHPEPKTMIARTMFLGILSAPLAVVLQLSFTQIIQSFWPSFQASAALSFFLWAALTEEYVKYLAVKFGALYNAAFDEPTDAMIYMISASLGFAAIENILVLFQAIPNGAGAALQVWMLRFAGATLLHAVSSALLGYFLALSWFYAQHSRKLVIIGIAAATFSHFVFNISLLTAPTQSLGFLFSTIALIILVILISFLFSKLRRRMVC